MRKQANKSERPKEDLESEKESREKSVIIRGGGERTRECFKVIYLCRKETNIKNKKRENDIVHPKTVTFVRI